MSRFPCRVWWTTSSSSCRCCRKTGERRASSPRSSPSSATTPTGSSPSSPPCCTPSSSLTTQSFIVVAVDSYLLPYADRQDQLTCPCPALGFALLAGSSPSWTLIRWMPTCISSKGAAPGDHPTSDIDPNFCALSIFAARFDSVCGVPPQPGASCPCVCDCTCLDVN